MTHSVGVLVQYSRVGQQDRGLSLDLPELTSIQLGENAFTFDDNDGSSELILRSSYPWIELRVDLPKLDSLTVASKRSHSFMNPQKIILESR